MKKAIILLFCLLIPISSAIAESSRLEQERRVEQEKRDSLRGSEARPEEPVKTDVAPPEESSTLDSDDIAYLSQLASRQVVYGSDACKTIMLLLGVEDDYLDVTSQVAFLKEKGYLPEKYHDSFDPDAPLRRGLAAYIFYNILELKGGVILRIFGPSERYAIKELAFEGILVEGNTNDIISGAELVSILTQSANYLADKKK